MVLNIFNYIIFMFVLTSVHGLDVNSDGKIQITVVTSSFCSDTVSFIRDHLVEAYRLYGQYLDIEFVPWGRTDWNEGGEITCDRHPNDCWANRVHRCTLNMLKGNQEAQMNYMACEFTSRHAFFEGSYLCSFNAGVNIILLDYCVANDQGDDLDRAAQKVSDEIMSVVDFVPAIRFNGKIDQNLHDEARFNLVKMICEALAKHSGSGVSNC